MPATCTSATSARGPRPGRARRAGRSIRARRGRPRREDDALDVARVRVGDTLAERLPVSMQRVEVGLRAGERPVGIRHALPRGRRVDVEEHRERTLREVAARPLGERRSASERDDDRLAVAEHLAGDVLLQRAEVGLPARREELGDR